MEIILFFIGWFIISFLISSLKNSARVVIDPLKIRVVVEEIDNMKVFSVYANGKWQMPIGENSLIFNIRLFQETDNKKLPIMCMIKEWTTKDNIFFNYLSDVSTPGTGSIEFTKEVKMISLPIESLKFPYKGVFNLVFELNLISSLYSKPTIFKTVIHQVRYNATELGYQDRIDGQNKFNENVVKIAAIVSSIDDYSDFDERNIVIDWLDDNQVFEIQKNLIEVFDEITESNISFDESLKTVKNLINEIKSFSSPADKMNIINLLHRISISDEEHDKNEEIIIRTIVKMLEIDEDKYNQMIFKDVKLDSKESFDANFDELLGLRSNMSEAELKDKLKVQYRIWNQKVTSNNMIESKNAKKVLEYISERRSEL